MRITAGRYRNRVLCVPASGLRPTTDRVRQALFNILGPVADLEVADFYAGSGAIGLEALSRGAARCTFVDSDRAAVAAIRKNLDGMDAQGTVVCRPVAAFVRQAAPATFDLVILDPPYFAAAEREALEAAGLGCIVRGRLVFEMSARELPPVFGGLVLEQVRTWGDTALVFYTPAASEVDQAAPAVLV